MEPRLNVITPAVNDLDKSYAFYRDGLGFPTKGIIATEFKGTESEPAGAIVLFELRRGLIFALYPRQELAKDARVPNTVASPLEFSLGYLVGGKKEVDELLENAQEAGGTITDKPHDRAWGIYSGYFKDLDGHLWEIIWHPTMTIAK